MTGRLVIFDCDGVLVDSEPIAMAVWLEAIVEVGGALDERLAYTRFLGRSLAHDIRVLKEEFGLRFLYAASSMGAEPSACVVIEDSAAGILAAKRAEMRVFAFTGGSHAGPAGLRETVIGLDPDAVFDDMRALPALVASVRP